MNNISKLLFILVIFATFAPAQAAPKLINLGTDGLNPQELREHWQEVDKNAPFDGIALKINFTQDGKGHGSSSALSATAWKSTSLDETRQALQQIHFTHLRDNFIYVYSPLKYLAWDDDKGWEAAISNISLIAELAKQAPGAHIKGIMFDPETWENRQYRASSKEAFARESTFARQRGAQMMQSIAAVYPDITILSLWLFSRYHQLGAIDADLATDAYGLWPSFINGWLDALPPQARLVDGMEDAYYFHNTNEYAQYYALFKNPNSPVLAQLLDRRNVEKYKSQVSVGFGFYLDSLFNKNSMFYRAEMAPDDSVPRRARRIVSAALNITDDYVWLYNEKVKFFPKESGNWAKGGKWRKSAEKYFQTDNVMADAIYPGLTQSLKLAKESTQLALSEVGPTFNQLIQKTAQNPANNLLKDGNFITGITSWDRSVIVKPAGTIVWDASTSYDNQGGSALINAPRYSLIRQKIDVQPGQLYHFSTKIKTTGNARIMARLQWDTGDHREWLHTYLHYQMPSSADENRPDWKSYSGTVQVPENTAAMFVSIIVVGKGAPEDKAWIDNTALYRLD